MGLAYLLGRSSTAVGEGERVLLPPVQVTKLCQVYHSSPVSVIQTSRGEPSKHWKEVACVQSERRLNDSPMAEGELPSAVIEVDFTKVPFGERTEILGFGGAFTEAAALNWKSLSEEGQEAVMDLLFGEDGLGYR